ncbi:MAG: diacylglycerol kinase family protein [Bacillota bacterium]
MNKLSLSFYYAVKGIIHAFRRERNMKIHTIMMVIVIIMGFAFNITASEWTSLLLIIGLVIGLEMTNTAIEALVDLVTEEYKYLAAVAKNVAAGAVLFASVLAVIIAFIIFLPYINA